MILDIQKQLEISRWYLNVKYMGNSYGNKT